MARAYNVTIVRYGFIPVYAESEAEAMDIANHQLTDTVNWSDDWMPTDADPDDDIPRDDCVIEKAF